MLPDLSIIVACGKGDDPSELLSKLDSQDKDFEIVLVYCGISAPKLPPKLRHSIRIYQTASTCLCEGEHLGAWIAFGQTLYFVRPHQVFDPQGFDKVPPLTLKGWAGGSWSIDKRTFWTKKVWKATDAWPVDLTVVSQDSADDTKDTSKNESKLDDAKDSAKDESKLDDIEDCTKDTAKDESKVDDIEDCTKDENVKEDDVKDCTKDDPLKGVTLSSDDDSEPEEVEFGDDSDEEEMPPSEKIEVEEDKETSLGFPCDRTLDPNTFITSEFRRWKWKHVVSNRSPLKKFCIYSIVYGYRGAICHPIEKFVDEASEAIYFTDNPWPRQKEGWTVVYIFNLFAHQPTCPDPPQFMSRFPKLCPSEFLSGFTASFYMDNNMRIHRPVSKLIRHFLKDKEWGVHKHRVRSCVYREVEKCIRVGKGNPQKLRRQAEAYRRAGMPANGGLAENNGLARVHNVSVFHMCHLWWREYLRQSKRDQISFAYIAWKYSYWQKMNLVWPNLSKEPWNPQAVFTKHAKTTRMSADERRLQEETTRRMRKRRVVRQILS